VWASSEDLAASVARGIVDAGCDMFDLGLAGTEEMYFETTHFGANGGICVTPHITQ
jgi:phosphomannomutase